MAPPPGLADTIRILVATDNHVGYAERQAERQNDSWNTFEEIMVLAKERDVDMVLLAGDLFHDNKPSRRSLHNVTRILRANCLGDRPCELEVISDQSDIFSGEFNHVNYEDPDINVSLPVFSIHGNHDDPSGEGGESLAALDLLSMGGLVNYYGKVWENDKIVVKPLLLQKGRTKLALYGMGNVRDERLFRVFREQKAKFLQPTTQKSEWFSIFSVHQNHVPHTEKSYLPETLIPNFLDLVVWGHEHECKIDPVYNNETDFYVMQPGSSIATSLMPGETVPKHVAILSITGKNFETEKIRLKTVRPFVLKEVVLMEDPVAKQLLRKEGHRAALTRRLNEHVQEMIDQARQEWEEIQEEGHDAEFPKPLIRLRVDFSADPDTERFDLENTQRFSSAWAEHVANPTDILQVHQRNRKKALKRGEAVAPDNAVFGQAEDDIKKFDIDKLVREYLDAQSLTILPQNSFGDAVAQFVDKDDKHSVEAFVTEALKSQVQHLVDLDEDDEEDEREALTAELQKNKERLEEMFSKGVFRESRKTTLKPKPDTWDSDLDGHWADMPGAIEFAPMTDNEDEDEAKPKPAAKGRGKATTKAGTTKKAPAKSTGRGRKKTVTPDSDEEGEEDQPDDPMLLDDDEDESQGLFVKPDPPKVRKIPAASKAKPKAAPARPARAAASTRRSPARSAAASQIQQSSISGWAKSKSKIPAAEEVEEISSDESDDFEPMKPSRGKKR